MFHITPLQVYYRIWQCYSITFINLAYTFVKKSFNAYFWNYVLWPETCIGQLELGGACTWTDTPEAQRLGAVIYRWTRKQAYYIQLNEEDSYLIWIIQVIIGEQSLMQPSRKTALCYTFCTQCQYSYWDQKKVLHEHYPNLGKALPLLWGTEFHDCHAHVKCSPSIRRCYVNGQGIKAINKPTQL